jgi:hypothetical protein
MNIKIIFRALIIAPIVLMLIYYFLPSVEYLWLSCDEVSLLDADGFNSFIPENYIFFIIYMFVWLLVSIGLFLFIRWFRIIYINFTVISMILILFLGNRISAPVETVFLFLMTLTVGGVLALMYSSSTAELFAIKSEEESKDDEAEDDEDEL